MLKSSASILVISLALQIGCVVLCALGYNWLPFAKRSVYQYGTVCSNGAFLGSALVDGIWGSSGLLLSSIYLIPQRVAMWSVGVSYFLQAKSPLPKRRCGQTAGPCCGKHLPTPASWRSWWAWC